MKVRRLALALGLALLAIPAVAAPPPLAGVGLIEASDRGGCSGTLVAPDLVLTAGHCTTMRVDGRRVKPAELTFRTGAYPGHPAQGFVGEAYATHPFHVPGGKAGMGGLRYDVALLRLAEPVPPDVATPIPVAEFAPGEVPPLVGSYRGRSTVRARERRCPVLERQPGVVVLTCAVRMGESGAPILLTGGDEIRVVGVLAAQSRIMRSQVAIGAEAEPVFDALRALLPPA